MPAGSPGVARPTRPPATDAPAHQAWTRLAAGAATARPAAREDHTLTVDGAGATAYLFGGRGAGGALDDLWRLDLASDTWTRLDAPGDAPVARFGHTATWVPGVGLVVWSGQAGSRFFDDLWAYDPAAAGWRQLPAAGDVPAKRYGSCAALGPDGRLWISHGFTDSGRFSDTVAYDFRASRWTDVTPADQVPVERCLHDCFWSSSGTLILYGGQTTGVPALGDLWSLTPGAAGPGTWEQLAKPEPPARQLYAVARWGDTAYVFGGAGSDRQKLADLWRLDLGQLTWDAPAAEGPLPAARSGATFIADPARGRLVLFGGQAQDGPLGDLWQLTVPRQT